MEVKSTRVRYIASKNLDVIFNFLDSLPFKVELKDLVVSGKKFYQSFVIPDIVKQFTNLDLD